MDFTALILTGRYVQLEPLNESHRDGLRKSADDNRIWQHMTMSGRDTGFEEWFKHGAAPQVPGKRVAFAVRILATGDLVGSTSYLDLVPEHHRVEIGATWYRPDHWGTEVNPECKLLLLTHAFEKLEMNRVSFVTDVRNARSQAAIAKLGAVREGVMRAHMVSQGGRLRDSVLFAITAVGWPEVKHRLVTRLATGDQVTNSDLSQINERYSVGHDPATAGFFSDRSAASHAAFFLPHLWSGLRVLDGGCGSGSITSDLARLVSPGEVVGLDIEPNQVTLAQTLAAEEGISNASYVCGNLYKIPFPDESFDAVFLHGVLEHLREPVSALREVRRVLKPDGILGARHADSGGFILEPGGPLLDQFVDFYERLLVYNGAWPLAGRQQLRWLREAGFTPTEVSASYDCWTKSPDQTHRSAVFLSSLVSDSSFARQLVATGIADRTILGRMREAFQRWGENPDAFAAEAWGEAVARRS